MPGESIQTMLVETADDGQVLIMLDGTRWRVSPGDIPTSILWLPTSEVEVCELDGRAFSHEIANRSNGERVLADEDIDYEALRKLAGQSRRRGTGPRSAIGRARRGLERLKPFDQWVREAPRTQHEIDMYWKILKSFKEIAEGRYLGNTITAKSKKKSRAKRQSRRKK